jgi:hypothetical protein
MIGAQTVAARGASIAESRTLLGLIQNGDRHPDG